MNKVIFLIIIFTLIINKSYGREVIVDDFFIEEVCGVIKDEFIEESKENIFHEKYCIKGNVCKDCFLKELNELNSHYYDDNTKECSNCIFKEKESMTEVKKDYGNYITFLVPSENTISSDTYLITLRKQIEELANEIGPNTVVVWLKGEKNFSVNPSWSKYYCNLYNLDYTLGPYILFTNKRPDLENNNNHFYLNLSGIDEEDAVKLILKIEQNIKTKDDLNKNYLLYSEVKYRIKSLFPTNIYSKLFFSK